MPFAQLQQDELLDGPLGHDNQNQGAGGARTDNVAGQSYDDQVETVTPIRLSPQQLAKAVRYNVAQNYDEVVWRDIQAKLDLTPTGYPDKMTVMAIVKWQQDNDLTMDGKVGPATLGAIDVSVPVAQESAEEQEVEQSVDALPDNELEQAQTQPQSASRYLSAEQVQKASKYNVKQRYEEAIWRAVQTRLGLALTGYPDKATIMAVAQWQKANGLAVDGMVGAESINTLEVLPKEAPAGGEQEDERQEASAGSQTFEGDQVGDMKDYFTANAQGSKPDSCIVTMNKGLKKLYGKNLRTGSTVQDTMGLMQKDGMVSAKRVFDFADAKGRTTTGVREPVAHKDKPSEWVKEAVKGKPGWHVFGLSLLDGYHSITITVDATYPGVPKIYWSDQWSSKGGFKEYSGGAFDDEILNLTNSWWTSFKKEKGYPPRSRTTLWKLKMPE